MLRKLKACTSHKTKRPEPLVKQRTSIVIIKADESDEEKREVDVTQQMSEMHMDVDNSTVSQGEIKAMNIICSQGWERYLKFQN
jgi:hypothetical protein